MLHWKKWPHPGDILYVDVADNRMGGKAFVKQVVAKPNAGEVRAFVTFWHLEEYEFELDHLLSQQKYLMEMYGNAVAHRTGGY